MRTIKFRGKDFLGRWHYGFLHRATGADTLMIQIDSFDSFGVIPDTVGQYTGLTDKNGKEIYEGDIVRTKHFGKELDRNGYFVNVSGYDVFEIKYINAQFMFNNRLRYFYLHRNTICEVIGNIHDNPELLKGGKE